MQRTGKRIFAALCLIVFLAVTVLSGLPINVLGTTPKVLNSALEEVTFSDFGIADATYTKDTVDTAELGINRNIGSLAGKVLAGDVTFSGKSMQFLFGGKGDFWKGLNLYTKSNDEQNLYLCEAGKETEEPLLKLQPRVAGTTLYGSQFNLKLSFELTDSDQDGAQDDVQLGVWINNALYNNKYVYLKDYADQLGNRMCIFPAESDSSLKITSELAELSDGLERLSFKDFGVADDTYTKDKVDVAALGINRNIDSLAGKVLEGYVTFSGKSMQFLFGGKGNFWKGLNLYTKSGDEQTLYLCEAGKEAETPLLRMKPDVADTTLYGAKFNLKLSFELTDCDQDNNQDDVKLGVWINRKLYNNQYVYLKDYAEQLGNRMCIFPAESDSSLWVESEKQLNTSLEKLTFEDFGIEGDTTYTKATVDVAALGINREIETMAGKVFEGNVMFSGKSTQFIFGGKGNFWKGLNLYTKSGDEQTLYFCEAGKETEEPLLRLMPGIAGTTLYGKKFNLKLSYELFDQDQDGNQNDVQLGVWINNVLYNNQYVYLKNYADQLGNRMCIFPAESESSLWVESVSEKKPVETLDPTLEQITFDDYSIADDVYKGTVPVYGEYKEMDSLVDKVFSGDVTFAGANASLIIGGTDNYWKGLILHTVSQDEESLYLHEAGKEAEEPLLKLKPKVAKATLFGEQFNLKLSYQLVAQDQDGNQNDLKLGVWINNVLYNNEYVYLKDYAGPLGNRMCIYTPTEGGSLTVASNLRDFGELEQLDSSLEKITLDDFNVLDKTYTKDNSPAFGIYKGTLDGKVFSADVTFTGKNMEFIIGGKGEDSKAFWKGIRLSSTGNGHLQLTDLYADEKLLLLTSNVAGTDLWGEKFNLKLSFQLVDYDKDGANDDLKLGIWINNILYKNAYIYRNDYADLLGNRLCIFTATEGTSLEIISNLDIQGEAEKLDETLEQITLDDFNIADGTYTKANSPVYGKYRGTLDGKVFSADVIFTGKDMEFIIGGKGDDSKAYWKGLRLSSLADGNLQLVNLETKETLLFLKPNLAKTNLLGTAFNLKMSFQLIDHDGDGTNDDLKLGVWINNRLYRNKYIHIEDYADLLGNHMCIFTGTEGTSLKLVSNLVIQGEPEVLDSSLEYITFSDFGIMDGVYDKNNANHGVAGIYRGSLDGKVFSADIQFSKEPVEFIIGGKETRWQGLRLRSDGSNSLTLTDLRSGDTVLVLRPYVAGMNVCYNNFNLKLSFQFVDSDQDGVADDLKLGVWLNNTLYKNKYVYLTDYADYLGNQMCIFTNTEGAYFKAVSEVRYVDTIAGSRSAVPNTGDGADVVCYLVMAALSCLMILFVTRKKDRYLVNNQ